MKCPTLRDLPIPGSDRFGWPWDQDIPARIDDAAALPKISVVIPSLNQGRHLEEAIRSVLLQGYPDLELIVMDGGSTDETLDVIRKYAPWIAHWASAPDRGQSHGINEGMARAGGDILAWIGCDDRYLPGALRRAGRCFADRPDCTWIAGAGVLVFPRSGRRGAVESGFATGETLQAFWRFGNRGCFVVQPSTFWRRQLWNEVGGVREDLHFAMDYELWMRFAERASLHSIEDALSVALRGPGGKTFEHRERQLVEMMRSAYEFAERHGRGSVGVTLGLLRWYMIERLRGCKEGLVRREPGVAARELARLAVAPLRVMHDRGRLALLQGG